VVSALVGIAAASGAIRSLDTPLLDYFPEYADLQVPERRQLTIRHALTMSAGFDWNENVSYTDPKNDETAMDRSADPLRYVLGRPVIARPADRGDRPVWQVQRFQRKSARASVARLHYSGLAAGGEVTMPVMTCSREPS
jgi:CubicO group peptidase (beta-lactamase class C family)